EDRQRWPVAVGHLTDDLPARAWRGWRWWRGLLHRRRRCLPGLRRGLALGGWLRGGGFLQRRRRGLGRGLGRREAVAVLGWPRRGEARRSALRLAARGRRGRDLDLGRDPLGAQPRDGEVV